MGLLAFFRHVSTYTSSPLIAAGPAPGAGSGGPYAPPPAPPGGTTPSSNTSINRGKCLQPQSLENVCSNRIMPKAPTPFEPSRRVKERLNASIDKTYSHVCYRRRERVRSAPSVNAGLHYEMDGAGEVRQRYRR